MLFLSLTIGLKVWDGLGTKGKVEPLKYLPLNLPFSGSCASPRPFVHYETRLTRGDPRRMQFSWSFVWPWSTVPLPVQRLIIQAGDILCFSNHILPKGLILWKQRPGCVAMNLPETNMAPTVCFKSKGRESVGQTINYVLKYLVPHTSHTHVFYL